MERASALKPDNTMPVNVALVTPFELRRVAEMPLIGEAEFGFLKYAIDAMTLLVVVDLTLLMVSEAC